MTIEHHENQAQYMALMVERWLGNPLTKRFLGFLFSRKNGERRAEKLLKAYAYEKRTISIQDKISLKMIKLIINKFSKKIEISEKEIKDYLKLGHWRKGLASTLEGLAYIGLKKPFISYAPYLIVWNITNACNLNCRHCYQSADKPSADELSTKEAMNAINAMADAGVGYIALSGGEPLYRKDFFDIANHIRKQEIGFGIATNGTILSKEKIHQLEELNCQYIQISLDGMEETHNKIRGPKAFERTIQGIKNAANSDISTGIAMTVTKDNYDEVEKVIELTEDLGANIFMHYNFIPTGRGKDIINLDITPKQRETLLMMLAKESKERDISLLSTAPQYGRIAAEGGSLSLTHFDVSGQEGIGEDISFLADFVGGCGCGRLYIAMQPNGDLTPCVFFPYVIGNIKNDNILNVWNNSTLLKQARKREEFIGNCKNCSSRNICGGCRARSYSYFKNVREDDPGCIFNNNKWNKIVNNEE